MLKKLIVAVILAGLALTVSLLVFKTQTPKTQNTPASVNPADFTTNITNKYFTLKTGQKIVFEGDKREGRERIEITISGETRNIMGVTTLVYRDRVFVNGELVEDTRDYMAQDKEGNVWYFGEDVDNFKNGQITDHKGSWIAGLDGAKAGILVKANPKVGESYSSEVYKGHAEDKVDVLSVTESVTIKLGSFKNCLKTYDWTPLEPLSREHKYYCPEVGGLVLEEDIVERNKMELISVQN